MERSKLYDQDMLDKARRIKDQAVEMKTLENFLHKKTKEMSDQLSDDIRDDSMTRTLDTHLVCCRVRVIAMTCLVVVHTLCR